MKLDPKIWEWFKQSGYSKEEIVMIINNGEKWTVQKSGTITFTLRKGVKQANKYHFIYGRKKICN